MEYSRYHWYYDANKKFLSLIGQWPYQKLTEKLFFMILIISLDISFIVVQVARLLICESTHCIFETLLAHVLTLMILVKLLTFYLNNQKIKDLTDHLFADWNALETEEEYEILRKYTENGRWFTVMYSTYIYVVCASFVMTALIPRILDILLPLNNSRPVVMATPAYYFVDEEQYFYYIFSHELLSSIICITAIIAHDSMFFTYVEHVCGLLAIVGYRFQYSLYNHSSMETHHTSFVDDSVFCKSITFSVYVHRKALRFIALLENAFSISFVMQMLIIIAGISISLIQISIQLHNPTEMIRYLSFTISQLIHLFCISFQGQKLINHSLAIREKIYNGLWYEIPVKSQRLLLFVLIRSKEVSSLTAGKIYVFSLENFSMVLQTSLSYFTMLSSFNES